MTFVHRQILGMLLALDFLERTDVMRIEDNGNLTLHMVDLNDKNSLDVCKCKEDGYVSINLFSSESQITIWYARQCEAEIKFASPGILIPILGGGYFGYPGALTFQKKYKEKNKGKEKCQSLM